MPSNGQKTERDTKGRFTAGNAGGGRKRLPAEVKEMFKAATPQAAKLLIDTMHDAAVKLETRLDCANRIIERVYGKPTQPIEGETDATVRLILCGELEEYAQ